MKHLGSSSDPTTERVRVKEGDRVHIPRFPKPEQHRNWRIKVRDAVVATSDQPEKAFEWVEATWVPGQTVEVLRDSDAKLASALTNVLEGDLARQAIFKEQEAKEKRYARGRQILFMNHKHFSTNIKHVAIYDFEDLISVQLINEDLKNCLTRWDSVIAGMNNLRPCSTGRSGNTAPSLTTSTNMNGRRREAHLPVPDRSSKKPFGKEEQSCRSWSSQRFMC